MWKLEKWRFTSTQNWNHLMVVSTECDSKHRFGRDLFKIKHWRIEINTKTRGEKNQHNWTAGLFHLLLRPPLLESARCLQFVTSNLIHTVSFTAKFHDLSTSIEHQLGKKSVRSSLSFQIHLGVSSSSSRISLLPHLEVFTIFIVSLFSFPVCFKPANAWEKQDHKWKSSSDWN